MDKKKDRWVPNFSGTNRLFREQADEGKYGDGVYSGSLKNAGDRAKQSSANIIRSFEQQRKNAEEARRKIIQSLERERRNR